MSGYLYVLSNPALPGLLKIGRTKATPASRLRQLSSTSVPSHFVLEVAFRVSDDVLAEKLAHADLSTFRQSASREFFALTVAEAIRRVTPIVLAQLASEAASPGYLAKADHGLSSGEVSVLQVVFTLGADHGIARHTIQDYCGGTRLDIEPALASLYSRKLVARRNSHDSLGPIWIATPIGVKLLKDHKLFDDWMRENSGA